jgi:hypothetical protein
MLIKLHYKIYCDDDKKPVQFKCNARSQGFDANGHSVSFMVTLQLYMRPGRTPAFSLGAVSSGINLPD